MNARAWAVLEFRASNFSERTPAHYVFPSERYGAAGADFKACNQTRLCQLQFNNAADGERAIYRILARPQRAVDAEHRTMEGGDPTQSWKVGKRFYPVPASFTPQLNPQLNLDCLNRAD